MSFPEKEALLEEIGRLRIRCGPEEMIEGDYAVLCQLESDVERLTDRLCVLCNVAGAISRLVPMPEHKDCNGPVLNCPRCALVLLGELSDAYWEEASRAEPVVG